MPYSLTVNGRERSVESRDPDQPLLYVLRNALGFTGPKFGCGLGQCGACTVIADGAPIRSCQLPVSAAQGMKITTIEGLGTVEKPHPVQAAFIAEAGGAMRLLHERHGDGERGAHRAKSTSPASRRSSRRWQGISAAAARMIACCAP